MAEKGVSGTKEWSNTSVNCMSGCKNGCVYCYARATACTRLKTKTPETWTDEEPILKNVDKNYGKRQGVVMFPTQHDLTKGNLRYTLPVLVKLVEAGNQVLLVSKPSPAIIESVVRTLIGCEARNVVSDVKGQVLFRFTIGSMDPHVLKTWEPGAPTFAERLYSLMYTYRHGWKTSVSMEPMLDDNHVDIWRLINTLEPYVTDAIWVGKANKLMERLAMNFGGKENIPDYLVLCAKSLIKSQQDGYIRSLYDTLKTNSKVKYKESIKKVVGLEVPTEAGLDV